MINRARPVVAGQAWYLCAALVVALAWVAHPAAAEAAAQDFSAPIVVPLQGARTVSLPGVTDVAVVEDSICRAETFPNAIRFSGLTRGETVVFAWIGERRVNLFVRVEPPPPTLMRAAPASGEMLRRGLGLFDTTAQVAVGPGGDRNYYFQHQLVWSQETDARRTNLHAQVRNTTVPGVPWNVDTLSWEYATRRMALTFVDFELNLNGRGHADPTGSLPLNVQIFRGVEAAITSGPNQVQIFAGTSLPSSYRSFGGTSRVAGASVTRRQSASLFLFGTTAWINVPSPAASPETTSAGSLLQTAGLSYRPNDRWAAQATGGVSNHGLYGDGAAAFTGQRFTAWASATSSSPEFPLNQLQLLSSGGTAARAAATWKAASRLAASFVYQYSAIRPTPLFPSFSGVSSYVNANVNVLLSRSQSLAINGVQSRSRGGLSPAGQTLMQSVDLAWALNLTSRMTNSAQVSFRRSWDPLQTSEGGSLNFRETFGVRVRGGDITFSFQRNQRDPSLVARLRQEIGLLPVSLQDRFLADPVAFSQSPDLPVEVRDLLNALQYTDSQFSVSGQFRITSRLGVSATYSLLRGSAMPDQNDLTNAFGYAVTYQLTPTLQLRSALTNTYLIEARRNDLVRTTLWSVGLSKKLQGMPTWLTPLSRGHEIEGRVFVDRNVTGTADDGETGLAGVVVQLDDRRTAVTDATGRFRFKGLKAGTYSVSMPLGQFHDPVRVTTLASQSVDVQERTPPPVNFGVVNFARVLGSVYNDYAHDGARRGDSPGVEKITVVVTGAGGVERRVVTDGSGEYRIDDLLPGSYRIEVDPNTIPGNFTGPAGPVSFEVKPVRTVVVDVPMRALRSVAGYVFVKMPAQPGPDGQATLVPVADITVTAGSSQSTTDASGRFSLRDLPAGDLTVTLKPQKPLPPGMTAPTGVVSLPKNSMSIENAVIVIHSAELLRYLKAG
jgi:hypothetical protein